MLGFTSIGESAIAEIPFSVAAVLTANGASVVVFVGAGGGVAATMNGEAFFLGRTRSFGGVANRRNQQFDFSVNLLAALLWQYNTAEALTSILTEKQAWYERNNKSFWQDWVNDVFDLRTANDFGCAVWAEILRLPLAVEYQEATGPAWGFGPYDGSPPDEGNMNFERGNFQTLEVTPLPLTLAQKRLALQLRYFQLFTHAAIPQVNAFLKRTFSSYGPAYVVDNLDMSITYTFDFIMPRPLLFLFNYYDLLPRPSGVAVDFVYL